MDHFEKRVVNDNGYNYNYNINNDKKYKGKKKTIYVSQPYVVGSLDYDTIKQMIKVCEEHGIAFDITADSDHNPGLTIMIEWYQKNKDQEEEEEEQE